MKVDYPVEASRSFLDFKSKTIFSPEDNIMSGSLSCFEPQDPKSLNGNPVPSVAWNQYAKETDGGSPGGPAPQAPARQEERITLCGQDVPTPTWEAVQDHLHPLFVVLDCPRAEKPGMWSSLGKGAGRGTCPYLNRHIREMPGEEDAHPMKRMCVDSWCRTLWLSLYSCVYE